MISRALERWKAENPAKVERITCEVQARCLAARLERQLDSTALRLEDEACHSAGEASLFVSTDVETGELQLKEKNGMLQKGMLPAGESFRNAVDTEDEEAQLIYSAIEKHWLPPLSPLTRCSFTKSAGLKIVASLVTPLFF